MPSEIDINGFKEIKDNPLSCVGVFPYLGKDLPGAENPNSIYYVLRPEEELSDPDCINSFKLLPWVDDHTMLGGDFTPAERKGVHGVIGEDVYYKDGFLRGNLKIFSNMLERLISTGKKDLSCGYRCIYEKASGVFNGKAYDYIQRRIRGNHLALVDEGRMGPEVSVLDGLDITYTFTLDSKGLDTMNDEEKKAENAATDEDKGSASEMTLTDLAKVVEGIVPQLAAINQAIAAMVAPATTTSTEDQGNCEIKAMDSKIKSLSLEIESLKSGATKNLMGEVSRRNKLYDSLSKHVGAFDHLDMTEDEMAKYGVKELNIACDSGHELSALKGYLQAKESHKTSVVTDSKPKAKGSAVISYINGGN